MILRVLTAVAAIGFMSLTALAQTPQQNESARKATAERLIKGETVCKGCDLFQVDLSYQELGGRDLSGARLRQADLSLSTFDGSTFAGANMSVVNAFGIRAQRADFSDVDFQDAVLVGGWFGHSKFDGARLQDANISGSDLSTATGLTQSQLDAACGDSDTRLPPGMSVPACATDDLKG